MNRVLNQLNKWRSRWKPPETEENHDQLNRYFAQSLSSVTGKEVIDYLISTYYKPIEMVGQFSEIPIIERNGQMKMLVDILTRIDTGLHPMANQVSPSTEQPFDPRA